MILMTNYCIENITAEFIGCSNIPWIQSKETDFLFQFVPHQASPIHQRKEKPTFVNGECQLRNSPCICTQNAISGSSEYQKSLDLIHKNPVSVNWLDPRGLPIICLGMILNTSIKVVQTNLNTSLGLLIPKYFEGCGEEILEADRRIGEDQTENSFLENIWYPALTASPSFLSEAANIIDPTEIFPIVEYASDDSLGIDQLSVLLDHIDLLDKQRVRTEKILYINENRPDHVFSTLAKSFNSFKIGESIQRVPVLTPGGNGPTAISMMLAGIIANGLIVTPKNSIFPIEKNPIWGVCIIRRLV